jgi:hypothetical protein
LTVSIGHGSARTAGGRRWGHRRGCLAGEESEPAPVVDYADFERPVSEPGFYTVGVRADGESATVETRTAVSEREECLGLEFHLGAATLHAEHRSYQQCDDA